MQTLDVLIPHFNDPDGLRSSLQSVVDQTWGGSIRTVVVDDGSSKQHRKDAEIVLDSFGNVQRLRIEYLRNAANKGRPYTRNVLLDAIGSQFVSWLDAGDEWYPGKLRSQFDAMSISVPDDQAHQAWITCNYDWKWRGGAHRYLRQRTDQDQQRALLMGTNLRAYLWTILGTATSFKTVGYFDERLPRLQDLDFFIRFVANGGVIHSALNEGAQCAYHKSDVGRDADEIRACNDLVFHKHRALYEQYGDNFISMRLFNMDMLSARFAQNNRDFWKTSHYLLRAFKRRPFTLFKHLRENGFSAQR